MQPELHQTEAVPSIRHAALRCLTDSTLGDLSRVEAVGLATTLPKCQDRVEAARLGAVDVVIDGQGGDFSALALVEPQLERADAFPTARRVEAVRAAPLQEARRGMLTCPLPARSGL